MGRVPITVMGYRCERCCHEWVPKNLNAEPKVCPKCKSAWWNRPREPKMTYDNFRSKVEKALRSAKQDLTWTEIRTVAKLPQMFPNNQWVHKLEKDIGLQRQRDTHGIIRWRIK
jgi:hypothetical protein